MRLPPLNALRAFEATARFSSLSRAADELCVTHAAISHQIKQLEEWFNRPLFTRNGRGVQLNAHGERLYAVVGESLSRIAVESARLLQSDQPSLSVACIPSIATYWLVPALHEFQEMFPEISVQVRYAHASDLLDDDDDVLITLGEDPSPNRHNTPIFSRINKPVTSPHYLRLHPDFNIATAELLHDEHRSLWQDWFSRAGMGNVDVSKGVVFQDFNMLSTAVLAGHGVALCPINLFRRQISEGYLVVLSDVGICEDNHYYLTTTSNRSEAVSAFVDWFMGVTRE